MAIRDIKVLINYNYNCREVKKKLIDLGLSQSDIARRLGVSRAAVSACIAGRLRSAKIEAAIKAIMEDDESWLLH